MFDGGLTADHGVVDTVYLLDVFRDGHFGIDKGLERGELAAVPPRAYGAEFDQSVRSWKEIGGFGAEDAERSCFMGPDILCDPTGME